ncbi:uncharacterized protein MONBRDRAFT_33900 [Monosiga brevicollis MX1]|uniref:Cytochrome c domain-containing protein n=1 Tax=Monosiga brevicollis TaxID=81824 RepID=A9V8B2_MONBE|nr:uncharacterized protein MONBRDRAFT_33900 [Monosiga brevicollis MX1]EDQ86308.1 predicted protein [Monosiga brevicollis MX1]|eukprot:XP_001748978.1 hypothetical protein [Monosiga brevicollis MX1]
MADVEALRRGKKLFIQKCAMCHATHPQAPHKSGPNLAGLFGRQTGQAPNYPYTDANRSKGITWTRATLDTYLIDPRKYIPGTKMNYPGLKDAGQRQDLIAFLEKATACADGHREAFGL